MRCHDDSIHPGWNPAEIKLISVEVPVPISKPVDAEAYELLTRSPLALLITMLLDQHITQSWAA
jgi:hypothetical protein